MSWPARSPSLPAARNIGRATAEELAGAGCALVINSLHAQDLCDEVVACIRASGGKAIAYLADIRDRDQVNAMARAAIDEFGGVDIVIHNAAVRSNTAFEDLDWETFKASIDLSIHGCFHLAKAVVPSMKARGGGCIIGVGGMSSLRGSRLRSHIMAGKMGMNALIRGLALDLAQYNIRANQVVVGSFDTIREGNPSSAPLLDANPGLPVAWKSDAPSNWPLEPITHLWGLVTRTVASFCWTVC